MKSRPFLQTALLSILGRSGGLVIPFLAAAVYGADGRTDAFFFSYSLAIAATTLFSHMFESALIPHLAPLSADFDKAAALTRRAFLKSLPFFAAFGAVVAFALRPLLAAGNKWPGETAFLASGLFMEFQPFLWAGLAVSAWNGIFYHRRIFWLPAVSPLIRSLTAIFCLWALHRRLGIHALAIGFVIGEWARLACSKLAASRLLPAFRPGPSAEPAAGVLRLFFKDAGLQTAALLAVNLMVVSDQWFAGRAGAGSLTLLSYADRLVQIPYLFFLSGFLNIFHADWSQAQAGLAGDFWQKLKKDLTGVLAVAAVLAAVMAGTSGFWTGIFYGTQKITLQDRQVLNAVFFWYAAGFAPGILRLALGRALIVLKESRFYFLQAWAELALNVVLNALLMPFFGVPGIAMATACVYSLSALWLLFFLAHKKNISVKI